MFQTQPALLDDFSGGITDKFIDARTNRYQEADNLLISVPNKKLFTRAGSIFFDDNKPQLPTGNQRIGTLINFNEELLTHSNTNIYFDDGVNWTELLTVDSKSLVNAGDVNTMLSTAEWNDQLLITNEAFSRPVKLFKDNGGNYKSITAGLPALATEPNLAGTAGVDSYIYAFYYEYTYTVGDRTYLDAGPVTQVQILNINTPDVNVVNITGIPVLTNAVDESYDVSNIKIKIYRTQKNETTLNFLAEVTNGTTIYNDTASDASIINNATIYTTGGVLNNDAPPLCKYVHVNGNVGYYAHIKDGTNVLSNRILLSVTNDIDSVPAGNFIDVDRPITGISSHLDRTIAFSQNKTYRLEGTYSVTGGGAPTYQTISHTIGCVSNQSIVQTPHGLVFADEDGFAYTDGFTVVRITDQLAIRYKGIVVTESQRKRIQGKYDKENRRVHWTVQTDEAGGSDTDKQYVLDTRFGLSPESTFTTLSGGIHNPDNYSCSAIEFLGKQMIRADKRGFIFKHDEEVLTDPLVDLLKVPADWDTTAIIYNFISVASSLGDSKYRKIAPKMNVQMENVSNLSMLITSISDMKKVRTLKPVRFRGNLVWGDPLFAWNEPTFKWGTIGFIGAQRHFDSNDLRFTYKQIQLSNAETIIVNSDSLGTGTTNTTLKTLTLDESATFDWPQDVGTYKIAFDNDGYTKQFDIVSRSDDTLVLSDAGNLLPSGSGLKYHMIGYAKNEVLSLLNITILYALLGQTQPYFEPSSLGSNA